MAYAPLFSPEISIESKKSKGYMLTLHNDEINSFEHVFESLVAICEHNPYQAEQCTMIAHFKGQCEIKLGEKHVLEALRAKFAVRKITTTVDLSE